MSLARTFYVLYIASLYLSCTLGRRRRRPAVTLQAYIEQFPASLDHRNPGPGSADPEAARSERCVGYLEDRGTESPQTKANGTRAISVTLEIAAQDLLLRL